MTNHPEIVVVGSHAPGLFVRVDRLPFFGETVIGWDYKEPMDGGKGSNQAIAAARMGGSVSFVGCFGQDRIGNQGIKWLEESGVNLDHIFRSPDVASGVGFIMLDANGVPAMVTSMGANGELNIREVKKALADMKGASLMLTQFEIPLKVSLEAACFAQSVGMKTVINPAPAPIHSFNNMGCADILVPNEFEAKALLGIDPKKATNPAKMAKELRQEWGAQYVIITSGEKGVVGSEAAGEWIIEAPKIKVKDTGGAGDVFCASLCVELTQGKTIQDAALWACYTATLSVGSEGTIPAFPTREEVTDWVSSWEKNKKGSNKN